EHGITPIGIQKAIRARLVEEEKEDRKSAQFILSLKEKEILLPDEKEELIKRLSLEMREAAKDLDFETAAIIRDQIKILKR
ncbi:MAG: UvrABC system protein B, partial [Candidatus Levybacteria bacterium GW2011_GWB1_41_21]